MGVIIFGLSSCAPTSQSSVCAAYDDLARTVEDTRYQVLANELFDAADELGDKASRYPDDPSVRTDGDALQRIADRTELSVGELEYSSLAIADLCQAPSLLNHFH